jgi:hypothetical protein
MFSCCAVWLTLLSEIKRSSTTSKFKSRLKNRTKHSLGDLEPPQSTFRVGPQQPYGAYRWQAERGRRGDGARP